MLQIILAIIKMAKIFACYTLIAAVLKQCFGISTKRLVMGFLILAIIKMAKIFACYTLIALVMGFLRK